MPRDVSLSDSKCWNGEQKWVEINEMPCPPDPDPGHPLPVEVRAAVPRQQTRGGAGVRGAGGGGAFLERFYFFSLL